jgi:excisionase family DNA binding protein
MTTEHSPATSEKSYLRVPEIAEDLDVSLGLVYRWIRMGTLKSTRLGKQTARIHRDDYQRFLEDADEGLLW